MPITRFKLREENLTKFKELSYLKFVQNDTLNAFWKQAVLNFDKDFTQKKDHSTKVFEDQVKSLCLVERESDQRKGVLIYLRDSQRRVVVHKDKAKRVHITDVQRISNRWKIVDADISTLRGFKGMEFDEFYQYAQKDRLWDSCEREVDHLGQEARKISLGPLGRLMEDLMFSSKSLKECLKKFGKDSSGSDGMLSFIVLQIPLVGGTFYTVMEFYGLGKILKSNHISRDDKMEEVIKKVTKVGFTFGAVFSSSVIGQIVIPIPVVGALIGGLVGGVVSSIVGKVIDSSNQYPTMPYTVFISALVQLRKEDGSWAFDSVDPIKHILARWHTLCRTKKLPDDVWLTVICFVNISVYQSMLSSQEDLPDDLKAKAEEYNKFLEATISYLAPRVEILAFQKKLHKVIGTLSLLCKEAYLKMDIKQNKKNNAQARQIIEN